MPLHILERILRGTDAWEAYLEVTRGERGAPEGHPVHSHRNGDTGKFACTINRDQVTVNGTPMHSEPPATIPIKPRDYAREAPTGTSVKNAARPRPPPTRGAPAGRAV